MWKEDGKSLSLIAGTAIAILLALIALAVPAVLIADALHLFPPSPDDAKISPAFAFLFGLTWLLVWGITARFLYNMYCSTPRFEQTLVRDGIATTGTITHRKTSSVEDMEGYVTYTFQDANNKTYQGSSPVLNSYDWLDAQTGTTYTILYLPTNPNKNLLYHFSTAQIGTSKLI